jgi:hypothetical protein
VIGFSLSVENLGFRVRVRVRVGVRVGVRVQVRRVRVRAGFRVEGLGFRD